MNDDKQKPAPAENDKQGAPQGGTTAAQGAEKGQTEKSKKADTSPPGVTPVAEKPSAKGGTGERTKKASGKDAGKAAGGSTAKTGSAQSPNKERGTRIALVAAVLALLLALASAAGLYLVQERAQREAASLADRLSQLADAVDSNEQRLDAVDDLQQKMADMRNQLAAAASERKALMEQQQALNTALQQMTARLGRTTLAWRLAEVEYLLTVANQRLTLAGDRDTALQALKTADDKLRSLGDPALVAVRQAIRDEITALEAVQLPDITGMALTLGSLAETVQKLPLLDTTPRRPSLPATKQDESQGDNRQLDLKDLPAVLWRDLRSLVVIRRVDQPVQPLLPPDEEWYLRQNLQLKLEQARLSLLRGDSALFHHQLQEAARWIRAYFAMDSAPVKALLETLDGLQKVELRPQLPTLDTSLRLLREQMQRLGTTLAPSGEGGTSP